MYTVLTIPWVDLARNYVVLVIYADCRWWVISRILKGGEYDPSTSIAGKRHVSRRLSLGEVSANELR